MITATTYMLILLFQHTGGYDLQPNSLSQALYANESSCRVALEAAKRVNDNIKGACVPNHN